MKHLLIGLAFLTGAGGEPHPADTYPKNLQIDVLHYSFRITLADDTDEIVGEAGIDIRFLAEGVSRVRLDLIGRGGDGRGMFVSEITSSDGPVTFTHQDGELFIALSAPSRKDQRTLFTVHYRGIPATGLIIGPNKHGDRTFFSDNWPNKARNWLPTIDHPYDKATSELIVTAPNHYQVVSNGLMIEETDLSGAMRLTHWKQSVPTATWLYSLGVARFAMQHVGDYQGKAIQTWVYYQDRDAGFYDFAVPTKQVLEFYGDMVGPYSYEKLANIQAASVGGGMEAASAIFYGGNSVTGERTTRWRNVVIHEIAHQWFGNAVTESDWDDVWLSEGFATYFTLLFREHQYGRDDFVEGLKRSRDRVRSFYEDNPDYRIVHDNLDDMSRVTSSQTYQKGGWTLHMLRGVIGDEAFWRGIQDYYRMYRDKNASTDDFRRAMEEASGRDLSGFFQQWLYQGGSLEYEGSWSFDPESGTIEVELNQVQDDGYSLRMPVQLGIYVEGNSEPRIEILNVDHMSNRFTISVDREPAAVVLDPNMWVLMDADFRRRN
ncbi:MAG: M1 family metallopeptidase [Gemmatimonadetes bacterium]|nr:M1 family metallopeptidase [Gemmatimonadota bacterium]